MVDRRLRPKYQVYRIDEKEESIVHSKAMLATDPEDVDSPFVLMPRKDPAAFNAMLYYMQLCEDSLADEIRAWLQRIVEAEPKYGTQGKRNRVAILTKRLYEV